MVSLAYSGCVCVFVCVSVHILKPWRWVCRGFWGRKELQRGCLYCSWSTMVAEYLTKLQFSYHDPEKREGEAGNAVKMQVTSHKHKERTFLSICFLPWICELWECGGPAPWFAGGWVFPLDVKAWRPSERGHFCSPTSITIHQKSPS